jgi:hypothetical protein
MSGLTFTFAHCASACCREASATAGLKKARLATITPIVSGLWNIDVTRNPPAYRAEEMIEPSGDVTGSRRDSRRMGRG